ncbi:MAG: sensor domain-containing diguanylate cyclase [Thermodesulfobacteriota bacterium]
MFTNINFESIVANLHEALFVVDRDRRIQYWNRAAENLTGFTAGEVIGLRCSANILIHIDADGTSLCGEGCPLDATIRDGETRQAEVFMRHKSGHRLPVLVRVTPLRNEQGEIIGGIELFSDNTARQALRVEIARLRQLALIDPLTELPNRRYIESHILSSLAMLLRIDIPFGLLFMDIDNFKAYNDTHGHLAGDRALKTVADTFRHAIRSFDIVGRWGGEEFLGVFPNITADTLRQTAERLRMLVEHSLVKTESRLLPVTISVGGVIASPEDTMELLIHKADTALYRSKQSGKNRVTIHEAGS